MRLRISDPALVPDLIGFLEARADMVTARLGEDEVEVSLLGSYGLEAGRLALDLLVRAWEAGRATADPVSVELIDRPGGCPQQHQEKGVRVPV